MFSILEVLTVIVAAVAMALALAHALELPGKMRLSKEVYFAVQRIYYPGFTAAGASEPVSIILTAVLWFLTPRATLDSWLILAALLGLIGMQVVYWVFIHQVNKVWMDGEVVSSFGSGFLGFGRQLQSDHSPDWTDLRNRWEYAHAARAVLGFISFVALLIAVSLPDS